MIKTTKFSKLKINLKDIKEIDKFLLCVLYYLEIFLLILAKKIGDS